MIGERTPNIDRRYPRPEKRADGRRLCRICGNVTPKGKISYCSLSCEKIGWMYCRFEAMKLFVYRRDGGRCQLCGCDFEKIKRILRRLSWSATCFYRSAVGFDNSGGVLYDIDHIFPVVLGGLCDPENLRTLCHECHKAENRKLAAMLAEMRKEINERFGI